MSLHPLPELLWPLGAAFAAAAAVAWLLVHTRDLHLHLTGDHPDSGPQKLHTEATPRIGGLAVMAGLVAGLVALYHTATPGGLAPLEALHPVRLGIGFLPLFALGLVEDISKAVSVRLRMGVSLVAGMLAYFLAGVRIESLGLPVIDAIVLGVPLVGPLAALLLTLIAVAGLVHAMNIVDGLNGLLAGITLVILGVLAAVSARFGETGLMLLALTGMAATAGFAVFNFPRGRLFCGDAGAYLIGYLIAVIVILLVLRQKSISPWFALAVVSACRPPPPTPGTCTRSGPPTCNSARTNPACASGSAPMPAPPGAPRSWPACPCCWRPPAPPRPPCCSSSALAMWACSSSSCACWSARCTPSRPRSSCRTTPADGSQRALRAPAPAPACP